MHPQPGYHAAPSELCSAAVNRCRSSTTVTDVAFDCGFFHLSRFAERYRHTFGEPPSSTLANRLRAIA
ncbi:MAG: helix-turn-helix domain-containing protein [Rhodospirillales bacterium]|nr:helix-turn-helix domain-containing protein [Rhodospirillales bacterium]